MGALFEPLSTHRAGVASISAMDSEDVRLHVGVAREQLETDATGVLVADVQVFDFGIFVMLLVLMGLQHDPALDGLVAVVAGIGGVQVFVVRCAGQVVHGFCQYLVLFVAGVSGRAASTSGGCVCGASTRSPLLTLLRCGSGGELGYG